MSSTASSSASKISVSSRVDRGAARDSAEARAATTRPCTGLCGASGEASGGVCRTRSGACARARAAARCMCGGAWRAARVLGATRGARRSGGAVARSIAPGGAAGHRRGAKAGLGAVVRRTDITSSCDVRSVLLKRCLRPTRCSTPMSYEGATPGSPSRPPSPRGCRQRRAPWRSPRSRLRLPRHAAPCAARALRWRPGRSPPRCAASRRRRNSRRRGPTTTLATSRFRWSRWLRIQERSATMVALVLTTSARAVPSSSGWSTWKGVRKRSEQRATPSGSGALRIACGPRAARCARAPAPRVPSGTLRPRRGDSATQRRSNPAASPPFVLRERRAQLLP